MHTIMLFFHGKYRCAHFTAESYQAIRGQVEAAIASTDSTYQSYIHSNLDTIANQDLTRRSNVSSEYGYWGISWRAGELDQSSRSIFAIADAFPDLPGLIYPKEALSRPTRSFGSKTAIEPFNRLVSSLYSSSKMATNRPIA